jgi:hypothetical protein
MKKTRKTLKATIILVLLTGISGCRATSEMSVHNENASNENLRIVKNESNSASKNSNSAPPTNNNSSTDNDNLNAEQSNNEPNEKVSNGDNAVTFNSFGKVKTGMTVAQASQALGTELVGKAEDGMDCYYVNPKQGFKGVRFMVTNGSVARIDIESKEYATDKGAKLGDTEDKIKSLYKGIEVSPQKYDEKKHDMEIYSTDKKYLIIFETDGKRVTGFRVGKAEEVGYVEGCS